MTSPKYLRFCGHFTRLIFISGWTCPLGTLQSLVRVVKLGSVSVSAASLTTSVSLYSHSSVFWLEFGSTLLSDEPPCRHLKTPSVNLDMKPSTGKSLNKQFDLFLIEGVWFYAANSFESLILPSDSGDSNLSSLNVCESWGGVVLHLFIYSHMQKQNHERC